jgi:hypothetical protein
VPLTLAIALASNRLHPRLTRATPPQHCHPERRRRSCRRSRRTCGCSCSCPFSSTHLKSSGAPSSRSLIALRWECTCSTLRFALCFSPPTTHVISTEGGALCRRSGEACPEPSRRNPCISPLQLPVLLHPPPMIGCPILRSRRRRVGMYMFNPALFVATHHLKPLTRPV